MTNTIFYYIPVLIQPQPNSTLGRKDPGPIIGYATVDVRKSLLLVTPTFFMMDGPQFPTHSIYLYPDLRAPDLDWAAGPPIRNLLRVTTYCTSEQPELLSRDFCPEPNLLRFGGCCKSEKVPNFACWFYCYFVLYSVVEPPNICTYLEHID